MIEHSTDVVKIIAPDGTLRYASPAFGRLFGHDPEEAVGTNVLDHVHPDDLTRFVEETGKVLSSKGAGRSAVEYRFRHADGSWRHVEAVGTYLLDDSAVGGVVVTARDVTQRREAEEAVRRLARRNQLILDSAGEGIYGLDREGRTTFVNPVAAALTGFDPEELIGESQHDFIHHSYPDGTPYPRWECPIYAALVDGEIRHVDDEVFWRKDGTSFPVEYTSTPIREDGEVAGAVVTFTDITERKKVEEALKESQERYQAVIAQSVEAIYLYDAETKRVLESNAAFRALMGYTEEDLLGMRIYDFIVHDEEDIDRHVRRSLKEKRRHIGERRYRRKDGSVIVVDTSASAVSYDGRTALCAVSRDVTERRDAEERLRRSEARLAEAQRLAHLGSWEWDIESDEISWSDEVYRIYGLAPQEFVPSFGRFMEIVHPEDRELLRKTIDDVLHGNGTYDVEHRVVRPDGEVRMVHRRAEVVRGERNEPLRIIGTVHDVTERKEAERVLQESGERFRALTQNSSDLITLLEADGTVAYQSPAIQRMLGYSSEELIGENAFSYVHPEDVERAEAAFIEGLEDPELRPSVEYKFLRKDGSWAWLESVGTNLIDDTGVGKFVVNSRDITERKEAEQLLREAEERYRTVVEKQTDLVCRFLPDLTLTFVNDAYCRYFGQTPDELLGRTFMDHIPAEDHPYYEDRLSGLGQRNPTRTIEHRVITPGGEIRWQQWTDTAVFDGEGRIAEYQSVGRDVTERRALEERLEHQALHDSLTDLPNRRLFVNRLGQALERTRRRTGFGVAVLFMDLDDFKLVNDSLGHEIGDLLLMVVAERLRHSLRPEDTLARLGGDEFVVLIEEVEDPAMAIRVAERITQELRRPFVLEGRELFASASVGIAMGDFRTKSPEDLFRDADTAMYRAKEEDSCYRVFYPAMRERVVGHLEAENDLRRAIERGEFVVHYQPIVDLADGRVRGVEALVRWEHPVRGLLNPGEFVPLAEESGLTIPLGERVLEEACRQGGEWHEEHPRVPPLVVSVNLSARQLSRPDLAEAVERVLEGTGMEGSCLTLDVTETVFVRALEGNTMDLERLRGMGVGVSIDDFGTGYSSLSYLKRLPADAIKVDRSFVTGLGENVEDTAIVRMVIELAHTLGMEVIAEGVENGYQADLLKEMGCDMAQGHHFAKPLPPKAASRFLAG